MAYTLTYKLTFPDIHSVAPATWEILFNKKDGPVVDVINLTGSAEPLTIEWSNSDEDKFSPIIGSKATIGYMYQGLPGEPKPDEFIKCQEDSWLIIINRNGQLYWKGFIKPDNNNYPFLHVPFEFRMNATDYFQGMKSQYIDLNDPILFLYDYITLAEVINRTLFHAVVYDDAVLRVLTTICPDVVSDSSALFDELYIHTDAFYDFQKGPLTVYECLTMLCQSVGMRMFYAAGSYWMQRISDLDQEQFTVYQLRPNEPVTIETVVNVVRQLGTSAPQNDMYYLDRTQGIVITPALKEQEFNFKLKAINQIKNFDWRTNTQSPFDNWEGDSTGFYQRVGIGSAEDPFRLRITKAAPSTFRSIWSRLQVESLQRCQFQVKGKSVNAAYTKVIAVLVERGDVAPIRWLDTSGKWQEVTGGNVGEDEYWHLDYNKKGDNGTITVTSEPIPVISSVSAMDVLLVIIDTEKRQGLVPDPGSNFYGELYPVFGRIFSNTYTDIEESITNNGTFSLKPALREFFFLDTQDSSLSNTLFYDDAGTKKALPAKNWRSMKDASIPLRDLDEHLAYSYLDAMQEAIYNIESDVFANALEFHNVVKCSDMPGVQFMVVRDKYSVRNCKHSLMIPEVKKEGTATGVYEVTPVTND